MQIASIQRVEDRGGCDEVDFNSTVAVSNSYLN
jgi:hypothetical protein